LKKNGKYLKQIPKGLIINHLTPVGLSYWIMGDGSLQNDKKSMILHTQSYSQAENLILSSELNKKFGFESKVISHKNKYWVIIIPSKDAVLLYNLIKDYIHPSMKYKLPKST
jgi:hypothetical protein